MITRTRLIALGLGALGASLSPMTPEHLMGARAAQTGASGTVVTGRQVTAPGGSYMDASPTQVQALLHRQHVTLVNVHIPYAGEIARTDLFIPFDTIDRNRGKLPHDKGALVILYCRSGHMSIIAAKRLVRLGYRNVWNLAGGMNAWHTQGLPLLFKAHRT